MAAGGLAVPLNTIQPGDLVIYYGDNSHVGLCRQRQYSPRAHFWTDSHLDTDALCPVNHCATLLKLQYRDTF